MKGCCFRFLDNPVGKQRDTPVMRQGGGPADDMRLAARHVPVRRHDAAKPLFRQRIVNQQGPRQNDAAALQGGRDGRTEIIEAKPGPDGSRDAQSFEPHRPRPFRAVVPAGEALVQYW